MNDFERLVAEETRAEAGPSRPTDVAAVVRSVATKSPKWRFSSMFGATKTLGAAATVALLGGLLVVSPLTQEADTELGAAGSGVWTDPVEFKARWAFGGALPGGDYDVDRGDGWYTSVNLGWDPGIVTAGDERLEGDLIIRGNSLQRGGLEIWNGAFRIENDAGAWQQRPTIQSLKLDEADEPLPWTAVFDGEGDYAGLTAIAGITRHSGGWDVEGVIVDATLPEPPTLLTRE
jgi:hypothetical protein